MKKDAVDVDRENLSKFAQGIGITGDIISMKQIHSSTVRAIENTSDLRISATDGLITSKKNLPLSVLTADCLPLLFYDPKQQVIGVVHAGYKGILNHIIENTIHRFTTDFTSDPKDIIVGIGPCIEMMCYEVSQELIGEFDKAFPEFENICAEIGGKYFLNLREVAQQSLAKAGILKEHIEVMNICTKCDKNFYSYRSGDKFERFVSVMSLV